MQGRKGSVRSIGDTLYIELVSDILLVTFHDSHRDSERNREINFVFERAYLEAGRVRLAATHWNARGNIDGSAGRAIVDFNSKLSANHA